MTTQQTLTCIGLLLDIIGVVFLYIYGLPSDTNKDGRQTLVTTIVYDDEKAKWKKYNNRSRFGLTLIIFGFLFQGLSTVWTIIQPTQ